MVASEAKVAPGAGWSREELKASVFSGLKHQSHSCKSNTILKDSLINLS